MNPFFSELLGTMLLILLGSGVVANVVLEKTKGNNSGWIVIALGWGIAVFVAVYVTADYSGAHLNPVVTLSLAAVNKFPWQQVPVYITAQFIGAFLGAALTWLTYRNHFMATHSEALKLAVFATTPAIDSFWDNLLCETIGTFVLIVGILFLMPAHLKIDSVNKVAFGLGAIGALPVALLILGIGLCLGGPTGYAINPARDLSPRLFYTLINLKNPHADARWKYSLVPLLGPILGACFAVLLYTCTT
ncbi:MAG: MIP/aquaporin family protein [Phycisphaerales bacterium]|nr:MIP/aquaporin family protein [Phycisphaerales bacterium]